MKKLKTLLFLSLAFACTQTAWAAVEFKTDASPAEQEIITKLFGSYQASNPSVKLQSSTVDLGDGNASIAVRFDGKDVCGANGCWTTLVHFDREEGIWKKAFELSTKKLEIVKIDGGGMSNLVVNGNQIWSWNAKSEKYGPVIESLGKVFEPTGLFQYSDGNVVDPNGGKSNERIAISATGALYQFTGGRDINAPPPVLYSTPLTIGSSKGWAVEMKADDLCDQDTGCPFVILYEKKPDFIVPILINKINRIGVMLPTTAEGTNIHDIALQDSKGYEVFRWNKVGYKGFYTSYTSATTPMP